MPLERPDLSFVSPEVRRYIEELETELKRYQIHKESRATLKVLARQGPLTYEPEPVENDSTGISESPNSLNFVTVSVLGMIKRTPRHSYLCQRRGGMGIFDLDTHDDDQPAIITIADESQSLLIFTNLARVFRLPLSKLAESPIRARGETLVERLSLELGEHPVSILPDQAVGLVALVSQSGMVRCLRHHLFGDYLKPGTVLFNIRENGPLTTAGWISGDADLFLATRNGLAIRFPTKLIPPKGEIGIRLSAEDEVIAITEVDDDSSVFILGADGKGTLRLMTGFAPNKSAGGSGKHAMKTNRISAAVKVEPQDDLFIISQLGKLIRFHADEVASSEGVVLGVHVINLRADEAVAAVKGAPIA